MLVEISHRANLLRIEGPEPNVEAASLIVQELYQLTENAQHQAVAITPEQVHLLISENFDIQYQEQPAQHKEFSLKTKKDIK